MRAFRPTASASSVTAPLLSLALALAGACESEVDPQRLADAAALEGDAENGADLYDAECKRCHGPDGNGRGVGPELAGQSLPVDVVIEAMLRGPGSMPTFKKKSDQFLADVAAYVSSL